MGIKIAEVTITKQMYGWSKYGGARHGLAKEQLDEWYCQNCGKKHTKELPSYFLPDDESQREFSRVCSFCKRVSIEMKIVTFRQMVSMRVANLITLPAQY